jgi:hypothetical protein
LYGGEDGAHAEADKDRHQHINGHADDVAGTEAPLSHGTNSFQV